MINPILKTQRFLPLLIVQFLGAFNDNLFKNMLLVMIAYKMTAQADILSSVVAGLFILPFFLFSATAGQLADKYNRDKIARILKITELILMLLVGVVFYTKSLTLLVILLFLMGTQSAFFGPIKYALLPQLLKKDELLAGNGYVEGSTYISIILGAVLGTVLDINIAIFLLIVCSVAGYLASTKIPQATAPRPELTVNKNIFKETWLNLKMIHGYPAVWKSILGATWFWTVGALVLTQIFPLCSQILNVKQYVITFFLMLFSVGVGIGSLSCNKLLKGVVSAIYVPLTSLAMAVSAYVFYALTKDYVTPAESLGLMDFFANGGVSLSVCLFAMAFFGGLYIVPLNSFMQTKAPKAYLASVIAGNNIVNSFGMAVISIISAGLLVVGFTIPQLFLMVSVVSFIVAIYIMQLLPHETLKSVLRIILSPLFRIRIHNITNFYKAGKRVLLIANHCSLLDGILVAAYMPEKITFAINTEWAKKWYIKPFGILVDLYPLDPTNPMAIRSLIEEVKKDKKVMIFPEGRITTSGGLMKIYEGAGVVAASAEAKIVPIRIKGAQFSKFSYMGKKFKTRLFPHISLTLLKPTTLSIPKDCFGRTRRAFISKQLYDIMANMMYQTSDLEEHLFNSLLEAEHIYGKKHKIAEDIKRVPLTYKKMMTKCYVLGQAYQKAFQEEERLGLLLPNSLANLVSFFALQSIDKVPAMMNFSLGPTQLVSSGKTIGLKTVITSRQFIEQGHLEHLEIALKDEFNLIYLEDFASQISFAVKLKGLLLSLIRKRPKNNAQKPAVVLFTSGSEGMPKAVFLSHKNIQANRNQVLSVLSVNASDTFFNALPMFHSFGLCVGSIMTTLSGIKTFYYPSPLHYRIVPELTYDSNATIICGTDTFLSGYGRMANPFDFFGVKYAIVGGEKLKETTADLWMKKFGVRILEGYGATETAPVISLNTPMYLKYGSVGRLLPGMEMKIQSLPGIESGGELWVKGDNVMLGYMKAEKPNVLQPPKNKWYNTGDIVSLDENDFISIQGRAKRFAKIAGEMVSLTAVEQALEKLYPNILQGIITIPDAKKGEQLVLITSEEKANTKEIQIYFKEAGLSELWIPKKVVYMKQPPVLGTGKFDYQTAKKLILEQN